MHRVLLGGGRWRAHALAWPIAALFLFVPKAPAAKQLKILLFNAEPETVYDVRRNSSPVATLYSSTAGAIAHGLDASVGDRVAFTPDPSPDLQPPPPPIFTSVISDAPGCARVTWLPSGDPTVTGYVVSFGTRSVASGEVTYYDHSRHFGPTTTASICLLPSGKHNFAVRAKNYAGMLSAYSTERSVTIVTLAVLISMFDARPEADGVRLTWRVDTDEVVLGYRVYRSDAGGVELPLLDRMLPPNATSFVDPDVRSAAMYTYVLAAVKENGDEVRSAPVDVTTPALALELEQNAPNPFNPTTRISFTLDAPLPVVLRVYDVRGALVASLFEGNLPEGRQTIEWTGTDDRGRPVSSGVYFYALVAGKRTLSRKMMLLK